MHDQTHSGGSDVGGDERQAGFTPSSDCPAGALRFALRFARLRQVGAEPPLLSFRLCFQPKSTTQEPGSVRFLKLVIHVNRESFRQETVSFFFIFIRAERLRRGPPLFQTKSFFNCTKTRFPQTR